MALQMAGKGTSVLCLLDFKKRMMAELRVAICSLE